MNIKYLEDTDTGLLKFSSAPPVETREISEDIYIDLDSLGALVSMTIEHAASNPHTKQDFEPRMKHELHTEEDQKEGTLILANLR